jgi:hypothetical protein
VCPSTWEEKPPREEVREHREIAADPGGRPVRAGSEELLYSLCLGIRGEDPPRRGATLQWWTPDLLLAT